MLKSMGLALSLLFATVTNVHAFVAEPIGAVTINPSDIYTVVATPIEANSSYKLELFVEGREDAILTTTRPLDDQIIDILIQDIDHDGKEELVVFMQEDSLDHQKIHFDIFEFEKNHLHWVENFSNLNGLLAMLYTNEVKD